MKKFLDFIVRILSRSHEMEKPLVRASGLLATASSEASSFQHAFVSSSLVLWYTWVTYNLSQYSGNNEREKQTYVRTGRPTLPVL